MIGPLGIQFRSSSSGISHLQLKSQGPRFLATSNTSPTDGTNNKNDGAASATYSNINNGNVLKKLVWTVGKNPIVEQLWSMRHAAKERNRLACSLDGKYKVTSEKDVVRYPRHSEIKIKYPFHTDELLQESYKNPWGQMRFGKILEDLDALAGNIAFRHVIGNPLIVTAAVDRIRLRNRPTIGKEQVLSGKVTWVGKSSMEIRMQCAHKDEDGVESEWLEAYFTFVARDPETNKATNIARLDPETTEERAFFELGALKAAHKKKLRKSRIRVGEPLNEAQVEIDKKAASLLNQSGALLQMPSLADPNTILMKDTAMQNAHMAQPQVRNMSDRIFGGFLMRRAFELAFSTAYMFGGDLPNFLELDDVSFDAPVDVGDLLVFKSRVIHTMPNGGNLGAYIEGHSGMPLVIVEVEAWIAEPMKAKARIANHFYFTFALPNKNSCRVVLPGDLDEARRMATRICVIEEQVSLS